VKHPVDTGVSWDSSPDIRLLWFTQCQSTGGCHWGQFHLTHSDSTPHHYSLPPFTQPCHTITYLN